MNSGTDLHDAAIDNDVAEIERLVKSGWDSNLLEEEEDAGTNYAEDIFIPFLYSNHLLIPNHPAKQAGQFLYRNNAAK